MLINSLSQWLEFFVFVFIGEFHTQCVPLFLTFHSIGFGCQNSRNHPTKLIRTHKGPNWPPLGLSLSLSLHYKPSSSPSSDFSVCCLVTLNVPTMAAKDCPDFSFSPRLSKALPADEMPTIHMPCFQPHLLHPCKMHPETHTGSPPSFYIAKLTPQSNFHCFSVVMELMTLTLIHWPWSGRFDWNTR